MTQYLGKHQLVENLTNLIPAFHQKFVQQVNFPIPPNHFHTLIRLCHDGTQTLTELSKRLHISKQQMTPIIEKLLQSGYVERQPNPKDRRSTQISIAAKGTAILCLHHETLKKRFSQKIEQLSAAEQRNLNEAVLHFSDLFNKLPD